VGAYLKYGGASRMVFNMNKKTRTMLYSIILLAIILLNLMILIKSKEFSCQNCNIEFKITKITGQTLKEPIVYKERMLDLKNNLSNGKCSIRWHSKRGYYYGN